MKDLRNKLAVLLLLCICLSCSKTYDRSKLVYTSGIRNGATVIVKPSSETDVLSKAEEDWNNINDALQNVGPGEVVQLAEGLFYLHKSIIVWDFDGTLQGAGKNRTTIQTAPGEPFDVFDCPPLVWSWQTNEGHFVLCFPHHSTAERRIVRVSDLKIHVTERATSWLAGGNPSTSGLQAINVHYENLLGIPSDLSLSDKIDLNVFYENISVVGEVDHDGYILDTGLSAFGASSGSFRAYNVDLTNSRDGINVHVFCGEYSLVAMEYCRMDNTSTGSYSFLNSRFYIRGNEFNNVGLTALHLYSNNPEKTYNMPSNVGSVIYNNSIRMNGLVPAPAILGVRMNHVIVYDNYISGKCGVGIVVGYNVGVESGKCEDWLITNNDLCDLYVSNPDGITIELNCAQNCKIMDNLHQVVGGGCAIDPSNSIGAAFKCYQYNED